MESYIKYITCHEMEFSLIAQIISYGNGKWREMLRQFLYGCMGKGK